jgi:DNA-binding transcriptional regulator YiaG
VTAFIGFGFQIESGIFLTAPAFLSKQYSFLTTYCQNKRRDHPPAYAGNLMGRKPKKPRHSYGAWLHFLRKEKGLSQDVVSKRTGIPRTTLMYWERSGSLAGRQKILKLAKIYGVSVQKLLRVERPPKK